MSSLIAALGGLADHYAPHRLSKFEGYYSKFRLPSGATLIVIICTVSAAPRDARRHNVTITYCAANGKDIWQGEYFPDRMDVLTSMQNKSWALLAEQGGNKARLASSDLGMLYDVERVEGVRFHAESSNQAPWRRAKPNSTPEGPLIWLPLPLHWHVRSWASHAQYTLELPAEARLDERDRQGKAEVHEEKNWAVSFPSSHMWVWARSEQGTSPEQTSSLCIAGGRILGMDAYLVGYRNAEKGIELDFRPPWALKIFGISPFMSVHRDWDGRSFRLEVSSINWKLHVKAQAPKGSFYQLSAPFEEGFKSNWLAQSQNARVEVRLHQRQGWLRGWVMTDAQVWHQAGLEFGGDYYPERGTNHVRN